MPTKERLCVGMFRHIHICRDTHGAHIKKTEWLYVTRLKYKMVQWPITKKITQLQPEESRNQCCLLNIQGYNISCIRQLAVFISEKSACEKPPWVRIDGLVSHTTALTESPEQSSAQLVGVPPASRLWLRQLNCPGSFPERFCCALHQCSYGANAGFRDLKFLVEK